MTIQTNQPQDSHEHHPTHIRQRKSDYDNHEKKQYQNRNYPKKYLKKHKYKIIARNYKKPYGEIDIIAENKEVIAFVEVKTRKENSLTQPVDAVNRKKQMKILKTADMYMYENNIDKECRFDVCEVFALRIITVYYGVIKALKLTTIPPYNIFDFIPPFMEITDTESMLLKWREKEFLELKAFLDNRLQKEVDKNLIVEEPAEK